ncbi:hypothetical protein [Rhodothermus marinus]|uniref:Uncharacterized protein n=1 Tax=Rhodothermus marinus (strain ATCC 43812 / DSM 4252 / R-10) TaxID=518766 RepID=D0MKS6_RHOM4|nr:hypothetical protein [Rhodothermus marinus]ACY49740.1 hypothetical protein Rmar_2876 [Rhodothermus marinus DSM 4252]
MKPDARLILEKQANPAMLGRKSRYALQATSKARRKRRRFG